MKTTFGTTKDGREASKYVIGNKNGMKVVATDFGATAISVFVKDKDGVERDVILGYDDLASYQRETCYFGATVGRSANRIAGAKLTIDGVEYQLEVNDNDNNLHSGVKGTSELMWDVVDLQDNKVTFEILSLDLEQGFPGNCKIQVTYEVTDNNEFVINYHAVSDKKTFINMTNHSYFNLDGQENGDVLNQELQIEASRYTPMSSSHAIPTGELATVEGTPFDFRTAKTIGRDIKQDNEQLIFANGYDHNFVLDKAKGSKEVIATAYSRESGIQMEVITDLPGVQLYTGNFVDGQKGKNGATYVKHSAFCLETQYFPNCANEPNFEAPIYDAGEAYDTQTIYRFSVR